VFQGVSWLQQFTVRGVRVTCRNTVHHFIATQDINLNKMTLVSNT